MKSGVSAAFAVLASLVLAPPSTAKVEYEPEPPICVVLRHAGGACGARTEATFQASIAPRRLPRHEAASVTLRLALGLRLSEAATVPSPLKELNFEFDRSLVPADRPQPTCPQSRFISEPYGALRARCRAAILGVGSVLLENQRGRLSVLPLTLFAGARRGTGPSMFLRSPAGTLSPTPLLAPVRLTRFDSGIYGYRASVAMPKIDGGKIAVRRLKFQIGALGRPVTSEVLSATCPPTGRIYTDLRASLVDGTTFELEAVRSCVAGPRLASGQPGRGQAKRGASG